MTKKSRKTRKIAEAMILEKKILPEINPEKKKQKEFMRQARKEV